MNRIRDFPSRMARQALTTLGASQIRRGEKLVRRRPTMGHNGTGNIQKGSAKAALFRGCDLAHVNEFKHDGRTA